MAEIEETMLPTTRKRWIHRAMEVWMEMPVEEE